MISSRQNEKLKIIRRLRRCKGDGLLLEGPHLVREAAATGIGLRFVLVSPAFAASPAGLDLLPRLGVPVHRVSEKLLAEGADADSPRGVIAVGHAPDRSLDVLPRVRGGRYVYLDGVQDPGNLGAVARVAEAAGSTALACAPGSAHSDHPRSLRASAGSLLRLPTARDASPAALEEHLAGHEPRWIAFDANAETSFWEAPLDGTLVLAFGAERGLDPALVDRASSVLRIPMRPPVESLNVATAVAVVLFELERLSRGG